MEQHIKSYRLLVVFNVISTPLLFLLNLYFFALISMIWLSALFYWLFFITFLLYFIHSLFVLSFIKSKYPSHHISNRSEGFIYLFAIVTFITVAWSFVYIFLFADEAFELLHNGRNRLSPVLFFASGSSVISSVSSAIIAFYSFRLLKTIRKNRQAFADQIKNIGSGNE